MSAAAQVLPVAREIGGAIDLSGERFGSLVALTRVVDEGRPTRWLLECDCGRFALRTAGQLGQSRKLGSESCCSVCLMALRLDLVARNRSWRGEALRAVLEATGSLYSDQYDEQFIEACLGELGVETVPHLKLAAPETAAERRVAGHGIHIHPISGAVWECSHCDEQFSEGFGCVQCIEPICGWCCEQHASSGKTLAAIGRRFGVGSERVRQMEAKAMRKLRHPSRSNALREFWDGVVPLGPPPALVADPVEPKRVTRHCGVEGRFTDTGIWYCPRCGVTSLSRAQEP